MPIQVAILGPACEGCLALAPAGLVLQGHASPLDDRETKKESPASMEASDTVAKDESSGFVSA